MIKGGVYMQRLEEMKEFFNRRYEDYDEKHISGIDGGMESKRVLASFLPDETKMILDLGIGTGLELEEIYKRFPQMKVVGIDIAEKMLEKLKNKYKEKDIELHQVSYFEYEFEQEYFDAVMSVMTLHHYSHEVKTALYKRIHDSIKKDGMYIECDYMISEKECSDPEKMEDYFFAEYERLKEKQCLDKNTEYHYDTPCSVLNQRQMLLQVGFKSVQEVWRIKNTVILIAKK